jgi:hypothetical protein
MIYTTPNPAFWQQEYWLVVYRKRGGRKLHCTAFDTEKESWEWGKTSGMVILMVVASVVEVNLAE